MRMMGPIKFLAQSLYDVPFCSLLHKTRKHGSIMTRYFHVDSFGDTVFPVKHRQS